MRFTHAHLRAVRAGRGLLILTLAGVLIGLGGCRTGGRPFTSGSAACCLKVGPKGPPNPIIKVFNKTKKPIILKAGTPLVLEGEKWDSAQQKWVYWKHDSPASDLGAASPWPQIVVASPVVGGHAHGELIALSSHWASLNLGSISGGAYVRATKVSLQLYAGATKLDKAELELSSIWCSACDINGEIIVVVSDATGPSGKTTYTIDIFANYANTFGGAPTNWAHTATESIK